VMTTIAEHCCALKHEALPKFPSTGPLLAMVAVAGGRRVGIASVGVNVGAGVTVGGAEVPVAVAARVAVDVGTAVVATTFAVGAGVGGLAGGTIIVTQAASTKPSTRKKAIRRRQRVSGLWCIAWPPAG
jgi:hypothetical protein